MAKSSRSPRWAQGLRGSGDESGRRRLAPPGYTAGGGGVLHSALDRGIPLRLVAGGRRRRRRRRRGSRRRGRRDGRRGRARDGRRDAPPERLRAGTVEAGHPRHWKVPAGPGLGRAASRRGQVNLGIQSPPSSACSAARPSGPRRTSVSGLSSARPEAPRQDHTADVGQMSAPGRSW